LTRDRWRILSQVVSGRVKAPRTARVCDCWSSRRARWAGHARASGVSHFGITRGRDPRVSRLLSDGKWRRARLSSTMPFPCEAQHALTQYRNFAGITGRDLLGAQWRSVADPSTALWPPALAVKTERARSDQGRRKGLEAESRGDPSFAASWC
jgi:hypothetical protein